MTLPPVRIAWLGLGATCLLGATAIGSLSEPRIAAQAALNEQLAAELDSDQNIVRNRDALLGLRRRLHDEYEQRDADDRGTAATSRFLRDTTTVVQRHRTVVIDVSGAVAPRVLPAPAEPVEETPINLTLEGPYLEVLAVTRLLARQRVTATIDVRSIVRTDQTRDVVTAVLRVGLQHAGGTSS